MRLYKPLNDLIVEALLNEELKTHKDDERLWSNSIERYMIDAFKLGYKIGEKEAKNCL